MRILTVTLVLCVTLGAACSSSQESGGLPDRTRPVQGRTETRCAISIDFPAGWAEVPPSGRPFTQVYENTAEQLSVALSHSSTSGHSIAGLGDQIKRQLATGGEILESGPATVDGRTAFKTVATQTTATGKGIVVGLTIEPKPGKQTTIYVFSANDERKDHRTEIDALLSSIKVAGS